MVDADCSICVSPETHSSFETLQQLPGCIILRGRRAGRQRPPGKAGLTLDHGEARQTTVFSHSCCGCCCCWTQTAPWEDARTQGQVSPRLLWPVARGRGPLGPWLRSCLTAETDLRTSVPGRDGPCPLLRASFRAHLLRHKLPVLASSGKMLVFCVVRRPKDCFLRRATRRWCEFVARCRTGESASDSARESEWANLQLGGLWQFMRLTSNSEAYGNL